MKHTASLYVLIFAAGCATNSPFQPTPEKQHKLQSITAFDPNELGINHGETLEITKDDVIATILNRVSVKGNTQLSIADVRRAALTNNLDLQVSFFNPAIANETLQAEQSKFESTFNISANRQKTVSPEFVHSSSTHIDTEDITSTIGPGLTIPLTTGGTIQLTDTWTSETVRSRGATSSSFIDQITASITQPLLRDGGEEYNTASIQLANYQFKIATAQTTLKVIQTIEQAELAYWTMYLAWHALQIQTDQYFLYEKELKEAKKLYNANKSKTLVDIYAFESGTASQAAAVIQADNKVRLAIRALKVFINEPDLTVGNTIEPYPTTIPDMNRYTFDAGPLVALAIEHRIELLESELQLASDALQIKVNKNQLLPSIDLLASYSWNGFDRNDLSSATSRTFNGNDPGGWSFGLTGSIPISNDAAKANLRSSILSRLQSIATKEGRIQQVTKDVHDALDNLESSWMTYVATLYELQATQKRYDATNKLYASNQVSSTDVTQAIMELGEAKHTMLQTTVHYQIAMVQLATATGTLMGHSQVEWSTPEYPNLPE
jgi:outer membrane protein